MNAKCTRHSVPHIGVECITQWAISALGDPACTGLRLELLELLAGLLRAGRLLVFLIGLHRLVDPRRLANKKELGVGVVEKLRLRGRPAERSEFLDDPA